MAQYIMRTKLQGVGKTLKKHGVDERGRVQKFVTDDIYRRMVDYLPMRTGWLRRRLTIESPTKIKVVAPHARAQFFGVTKDGRPFNYNMAAGPKVGSHWDRRLMANEGRAIVADTNRYIRGL